MACSLQQLNFASDLNASAWDAQVSSMPFPTTPIPMPCTDNIIAELDMYTSAISTPLPSPDDAPSPLSDVPHSLFRSGAAISAAAAPIVGTKRAAPASSVSAGAPPYKKAHRMPKHEQLFEPVTPTTRKALCMSHKPRVGASSLAPLSPSQSLCTEEEDAEVRSLPPTPAASVEPCSTSLPVLSKAATAKRRALRRAAMKKSRSRRDDGGAVKTEATAVKSDCELSAEPVDKKAARAIRNREAAMKSRVEAKQKMQKLQSENDCLKVKVKSIEDENKALTTQLKSLLQHTYGVSVGDGQDVKAVFNMLAPVGCRS